IRVAGETVLDLGSVGGIDVLLSAKRVGATGFAYGLDMTDEMLELARRNAADAGATNVEFLHGHIEDIPLPAESVDVIISSWVVGFMGRSPRTVDLVPVETDADPGADDRGLTRERLTVPTHHRSTPRHRLT